MRNALLAVIILFILLLTLWIYTHFFEFKNVVVQSYISSEASKYVQEAQAKQIITDAVNNILNSYTLTKEVKDYAAASGLELERVLVDTAVIQAKALNYL